MNGTPVTSYALVQTLKRELMQTRKDNQSLKEEMEDLKKTRKVCVYNEMDTQIQVYSEECFRLR